MDTAFNGSEFRLARVFNGFSLEEVSERVDKTRQYIHKLEMGQATPTSELLLDLAVALRVEPSFFFNNHSTALVEEQFHFRKLFTTKAMIKQVAMARGELVNRLVSYLDDVLKLPDIKIPEVANAHTQEDIERAAELCRHEWSLGSGPIINMSRLAEHVGAIVTSFQGISKEIDALSVSLKRPIIVCNDAKESPCRQRFDIGHELGHFVLHSGQATGDRVTESQANRFSSALLIPRAMMAKLFPRPRGSRLDWVGIREFKLIWKVSKAAILYRARQLELISDSQYKTGVISLRRGGEATSEREDHLLSKETPELLARSLKVLAEKKRLHPDEIAAALKISPTLLSDILGFAPETEIIHKRPNLYLVN